MAFARKYEYFEVRLMLQAAEGVDSPVTQQPAHSRVLHAMGGGGTGATLGNMLDRVTKRPGESGNQFKKRGAGATGAFTTQLQQGSAACEALNSRVGQEALAWFDDIEYQGSGLRLVLTAPVTRELGFLPASGAPSEPSPSIRWPPQFSDAASLVGTLPCISNPRIVPDVRLTNVNSPGEISTRST